MLSTIAGRRVWVSKFIGTPCQQIVNVPVRRRGFSIRRKVTIYQADGSVYLLGDDACVMHPDDFENLKKMVSDVNLR